MSWPEYVEAIKKVEARYFNERVVKASIPVRGPDFIEGLKASYTLNEGPFCVTLNNGETITEIPA